MSSKSFDDEDSADDEHDDCYDDEKIHDILTEPPSRFICPLTLEVMKHPVISMDGHNFERDAIVAWLSNGNDSCPLTRKALDMWDLKENQGLREDIHQWKKVGEAYRILKIRDRIMVRHAAKLVMKKEAAYDDQSSSSPVIHQ